MSRYIQKRLQELHPRAFFLATWQSLDQEANASRAQSTGYDYRPLIAFGVGAICLGLMEYVGNGRVYFSLAERLHWQESASFFTLGMHAYWAFWRVLGYFIIPALTVKFIFKHRLRDYGLLTEGFSEHIWIYCLSYAIVLIAVVVLSFTSEFSNYYPFYKLAHRSWLDFLTWEALYASQFFSLEFFFRGFWLSASRKTMGSNAIFAMIVPYSMIHYGKPWLETQGAIVAGIVLGTLAMKTRSIWSGFLIHVSVAVSMDIAALLQTASLPAHLLPSYIAP